MPLKKTKTGTITGANLEKSNRGKKGGLTGSKRVTGETTETTFVPATTHVTETTSDTVANTPQIDHIKGDETPEQAEARRNRLAEKLQQGSQAVIGAIVSTASTAVQATQNGSVGNTASVDFAGICATGSAEVPRYVEGISNAEAVKRRLEIQRQRNTVAVMTDNKKLEQDIVQLGIEHRKVEGKVIEYHTEGVHNQRKGITFHRAEVARDTEASKLTQDKELLSQQNIATQGTQALTAGVQKEWQQKLEHQQVKSEHLKLEIESAKYENEYKRQELEAKLLSGF
jgi:hypothetical protein